MVVVVEVVMIIPDTVFVVVVCAMVAFYGYGFNHLAYRPAAFSPASASLAPVRSCNYGWGDQTGNQTGK
jgi:hypothetical protein